MKLIFLGTGNAFTVGHDNFQSNMLFENEAGQYFLFDCGSDIRHSLNEQGLSHRDIDALFVSHLHADHVGGLEWLAFSRKFDCDDKKPDLYTTKLLRTDLWDNLLAVGLSSLADKSPTLDTYFTVHMINDDGIFQWQKQSFELVKTIHALNNKVPIPSYGIKFVINKHVIFITGDVQFRPEDLTKHYEEADLIFHDCDTGDKKIEVHAHYLELKTLPASIKSKMWLYDYNEKHLPDAKKDGFRGLVVKGQCFDLNDPKIFA